MPPRPHRRPGYASRAALHRSLAADVAIGSWSCQSVADANGAAIVCRNSRVLNIQESKSLIALIGARRGAAHQNLRRHPGQEGTDRA